MKYSIYKSIDERTFTELKSRLDVVADTIVPTMELNGFYLNKRSYDEVLTLDFVRQDADFMGNIGVGYDDKENESEEKQFYFYILKAFDANGERFYLKVNLEWHFSIIEVENEHVSLFTKCLDIYNSLTKEDLTEKIVLKK